MGRADNVNLYNFATPMIKYKDLRSHDLTMDLTKNEAREAIKVLALKRDNLDIIVMSIGAIIVTLFFIFITIVFLGTKNLCNLSGLALVYLVAAAVLVALSLIFAIYYGCKSKKIKNAMEELAREHGLKKFYHAISDVDKNEWMVPDFVCKMMQKNR